MALNTASSTTGDISPATTFHQAATSLNTLIFARATFQNASPPPMPAPASRSATPANGSLCSNRALKPFRSSRSKRAGAVEIFDSENPASRLSRLGCGSIASDVPMRAACDSTAIGSRPASRNPAIERLSRRFDSAWPSAPISSEWWAMAGASEPSASNSWICTPEFVTWSSPRMMWVMAKSMSSTTLVKVYSAVPSSRINTGSDSEPTSTI